MKHFLKICLGMALLGAPAFAYEMGKIVVPYDNSAISVAIECNSPELEALARKAFDTHGLYRVVPHGQQAQYDLKFSWPGGNNVRVDVVGAAGRGNASQSETGRTAREALLKAADFAVEHTNRLGLKGYFASKIAFVVGNGSHKDVYLSDLFFQSPHQVTNDGRDAMFPRWSPDGTRLLYTSYLHGYPDIYEINLTSYTRSVIASFKGTNFGARFNPSGSRIAMVLSGTGSPQLYVADASGHGRVQLTRSSEAKAGPCFSPDGSRIVFAMEPGPRLYTMSSSGGYPQLLTRAYNYQAEPDWIRAGGHDEIAFTCRDGEIGGGYQIAVDDLGGGGVKTVSRAPFDGIEPSWLPDGRHLVYTARDRSSSVLAILDTVSGKSTRISPLGRAVEQANVLR